MFGLLLFNGSFSTNRLYRAIEVWNTSRRASRGQDKHTFEQWNKKDRKHSSAWALWRQSHRYS